MQTDSTSQARVRGMALEQIVKGFGDAVIVKTNAIDYLLRYIRPCALARAWGKIAAIVLGSYRTADREAGISSYLRAVLLRVSGF